MKTKFFDHLIMFVSVILGIFVGEMLWSAFSTQPYDVRSHMCPCDACKVRRQLESIELIDSIIKDRIVFVVENGYEKD